MKKLILKRKKLFSFLVPFLIIALLIGVAVVKQGRDKMVTFKTKTIPDVVKILAGNATTIKEVANLKEESGVYSFDLSLEVGGQAQKYTSYMTKDGKIFFTSGTKVNELGKPEQTAGAGEQQTKLTCADVKKADAPKLTAYIVADCPFGLQMQRVMNKAITEQPALASVFDVRYIGAIENGKITSMHGDAEAQENLRQICIREEQKNLYWPYVSCYMKAQGQSAACITQIGVNVANVNACMTDAKRGNMYAQKDFDLANKFTIGSSPTLLINDTQIVSEFDFGGRTADALKQVSCCAGTKEGAYCAKALSTDQVAASFSQTDAVAAGGAAAANCGN
ncbi:MAG: hypothetical protein V1917_00335 [Candidatus Gottesmanbacteria bacterium]